MLGTGQSTAAYYYYCRVGGDDNDNNNCYDAWPQSGLMVTV
jgi:hypothetical protein